MVIKLKLNLWTHKPDRDGLCPVAVSIRGGGAERYYQTGVKVHPDNWSDGQVTKGMRNHDVINSTLSSLLRDTERQILVKQSDGHMLTLDQVKSMLRPDGGAGSNFIAFYRAYIDNAIRTGKKAKGTVAVWEVEYACFKAFAGDTVPFSSVGKVLLERYHEHLAKYQDKDGKGYEPTTLYKKLKKVRQIIRNATEQGLMEPKQMAGFEMVKYVQPETHYLTLAQTTDLANRLYAGDFDHDSTLRTVAAYFLVECYAGIRFSDWHKFEVEKTIHRSRFKVRTTKTKRTVYLDLTIFKSLATLLEYIGKHDLRFNLTSKTVNETLKVVGLLLRLKFSLSTHDGRRTFGTLLGEMGYRTSFIADAMGIDESTAHTYVKTTEAGHAAEMQRVGGF